MVGAYCYAMSSNYNGRPRPAEELVEGESMRCIRRRERYEDLLGDLPSEPEQ
jgi:diaminopimelate decarboxylase